MLSCAHVALRLRPEAVAIADLGKAYGDASAQYKRLLDLYYAQRPAGQKWPGLRQTPKPSSAMSISREELLSAYKATEAAYRDLMAKMMESIAQVEKEGRG